MNRVSLQKSNDSRETQNSESVQKQRKIAFLSKVGVFNHFWFYDQYDQNILFIIFNFNIINDHTTSRKLYFYIIKRVLIESTWIRKNAKKRTFCTKFPKPTPRESLDFSSKNLFSWRIFYNKISINIFCVKLRLKGFKRDFVKVS